MKVLKANKTHAVLQVTSRELTAILTALQEWAMVEGETHQPDLKIHQTCEAMHGAIAHYRIGKALGRPPVPVDRDEILRRAKLGQPLRQIAKALGVSHGTIRKHLSADIKPPQLHEILWGGNPDET